MLLLGLLAAAGAAGAGALTSHYLRPVNGKRGQERQHGLVTRDPRQAPNIFAISGAATTYDIGEVHGGERVSFAFGVLNDTPVAVTVGPFQTSCECFSVELNQSVIPAGEQASGTLVLDLVRDPHFRGGLMLSAEAPVGGSHSLLIRLNVNVR